jgi:hypothetical protein
MSQREKQPRLVRFTLSKRNYTGLLAELERRALDGAPGAVGIVLNELITRGLGAAVHTPPPPTAPAVQVIPPDEPVLDDDWTFNLGGEQ